MNENTNVTTIGKRIKKLRKNKRVTQKELAEYLGVGISAITMYETGKRMPPPENISKMADYFGTDTDYLMGRAETVTHTAHTSDLESIVDVLYMALERMRTNPEYNELFRTAASLKPDDVEFMTLFFKKLTTASRESPSRKSNTSENGDTSP